MEAKTKTSGLPQLFNFEPYPNGEAALGHDSPQVSPFCSGS